jgi:hypothetical protein
MNNIEWNKNTNRIRIRKLITLNNEYQRNQKDSSNKTTTRQKVAFQILWKKLSKNF